MMPFLRALFVPAAAGLVAAALAQSPLAPEPVRLDSLAEFRSGAPNWVVSGGIAGDPRREKTIGRLEGTGVLVNNPGPAGKAHLVTAWEHGDIELDLDFMLTAGSNSGVYLQGRYEVQLYDSWGQKNLTVVDCGSIYERWDESRPSGTKGFDGVPPRANASRAPGLWQHLHIEFRAPRFDAAGKKTQNARMLKVVLNGFTVQENVELGGPTRSPIAENEAPLGPLMIQGDHGAVAIRHLAAKRFDAGVRLGVENLSYKLYAVTTGKIGGYDEKKLTSSGRADRLAHTVVEKSGKFALVFEGNFVAARTGEYAFGATAQGGVQIQIDGETVVAAADRGGVPGTVMLREGPHPFRLDYVHTSNGRPNLDVTVEGPGLAPYSLTGREPRRPATPPKIIPVEVADRVLAQRSFVPFEPKKRLYAINVGTPAGVHFSYDLETAAILRVWRGGFLDAADMWESRGEPQTSVPTGPSLTFSGQPGVVVIENPMSGGWPDQPDALVSSQGYTLETDGTPTFLGQLAEISFRDRIAPAADGKSLTRTLNFKGDLPSWSMWVLLAEAAQIAPLPGGHGWVIGDREWYVDWPEGSPHRPVIRRTGGRAQLAVRLVKENLSAPLTFNLVW